MSKLLTLVAPYLLIRVEGCFVRFGLDVGGVGGVSRGLEVEVKLSLSKG